jgi:hypothetical protein
MAKSSNSAFSRKVLIAVRMLMEILESWLVITLKWNTLVASLILKQLKFPSKGVSKLDTFRCMENRLCDPQLSYTNSVTWLCISFLLIIPFVE